MDSMNTLFGMMFGLAGLLSAVIIHGAVTDEHLRCVPNADSTALCTDGKVYDLSKHDWSIHKGTIYLTR